MHVSSQYITIVVSFRHMILLLSQILTLSCAKSFSDNYKKSIYVRPMWWLYYMLICIYVYMYMHVHIHLYVHVHLHVQLHIISKLLLFWLMLSFDKKNALTPTWFEHATFWSGVIRATVAPRSRTIPRIMFVNKYHQYKIMCDWDLSCTIWGGSVQCSQPDYTNTILDSN